MRLILWLVVFIILVGTFGLFGWVNNRQVPIEFFGSYSIHLSVWFLVLALFVAGFATSWFYQLLFHPSRIVQRAKAAMLEYKNTKLEQQRQTFQDAYFRKDLNALRKSYNRLKRTGILPLYFRVQFLEQQRYHLSSAQLMEEFRQLKQQFPNNLQVLLPFQKLALENSEWSLAELLSQEILQVVPDHPDGLEGLSAIYRQRGEWEKCALKEKQLLTKYPNSLLTERLLAGHETHILKGAENNVRFPVELNLNHLPGKSGFKDFHRVPLVVGEAEILSNSGQHLKAASLLKKEFENTAAPVLLDHLEALYFETGQSEKIISFLKELKTSNASTHYVDLVLARIYYRTNELEKASALLEQFGGSTNERPLLHNVLAYLIAIRQEKKEEQLLLVQQLLDSEKLLDALYQCKNCGTVGKWEPICPQCDHSYSYTHRGQLG